MWSCALNCCGRDIRMCAATRSLFGTMSLLAEALMREGKKWQGCTGREIFCMRHTLRCGTGMPVIQESWCVIFWIGATNLPVGLRKRESLRGRK